MAGDNQKRTARGVAEKSKGTITGILFKKLQLRL